MEKKSMPALVFQLNVQGWTVMSILSLVVLVCSIMYAIHSQKVKTMQAAVS